MLINYEDQEIIELLLNTLLNGKLLKNNKLIEIKLSNLYSINETLKLKKSANQVKVDEYIKKYSNLFNIQATNSDKLKKNSIIIFKLEWWDRKTHENNFLCSNELLLNQKKFYPEVEFNPSILNDFYDVDFKVNNNVYEFISPLHLVNTRNIKDISTINNLYINKKLIFENNGLNLIYLDYFESVKNFNQNKDIFI